MYNIIRKIVDLFPIIYLLFLLFRLAVGCGCGIEVTTNEDCWWKRVIFPTKRLCVNSKENSNLGWKTKSGCRNT